MAEFDGRDFLNDKPDDTGGQSSGGATGIFGTTDDPPAPWPSPPAEAAKPVLPSVHEVKFHAPGSGDPGDTDPLHRILKSMPAPSSMTPVPPPAAAPSGGFTQLLQSMGTQSPAPAAPKPAETAWPDTAVEPIYTPTRPATQSPPVSEPPVPDFVSPLTEAVG